MVYQSIAASNAMEHFKSPGFSDIFSENPRSYLNDFAMYATHFHGTPSTILVHSIQVKKAAEWFKGAHGNETTHAYWSKTMNGYNKKTELEKALHILEPGILVCFNYEYNYAHLLFANELAEQADKLAQSFKGFKRARSRREPSIYMFVSNDGGLSLTSLRVNRTKLNLEENYNDDFPAVHQHILKRLSRNNEKGILLLHGKPGTGKTSYIRHLITKLKKEVIFLPPNMAPSITSPYLISSLIDMPNSILVIEDAEQVIMDRNLDGSSPVSTLLNISDGLLSDCLNIQIICSFNCDITRIDEALMRKGRLIGVYEFRELETEKARALSQRLGFDTDITAPMSLAAIYNQGEKAFLNAEEAVRHSFGRTQIGFKR
jgi:hypothetical protein